MNDPFGPIEEINNNLKNIETQDPFFKDIEKDLHFQDSFTSNLYEELVDGHATLFAKLLKEKIQKTPFLITNEKEKKRKQEIPFEQAKIPKYEDVQYFQIFQDIAIHTYSQPTRYTRDIFLKKMEFERTELIQALQKVKQEMTKEKMVEMKKKWKKILFHVTETSKQWKENITTKIKNAKKFAQLCQKEVLSKEKKTEKLNKESINRAKKLGKEVLVFWKKYEKESVERRKQMEKEEQARRKKEEEELDAKRQQRKLNFLLTQTELYSHFMSKKQNSQVQIKEDDNENDGLSQKKALELAQKAAEIQLEKTKSFDKEVEEITKEKSTVITFTDKKYGEPKCFIGNLKQYQVQGLNWLISLYEQGINGILADDMGLGKTVQCISFLGHLAEEKNIWGPHLIISPSSTLHNWVHEFEKFCPTLKVMPYWGNPNDRKTLRKFWNPKNLYTKGSPFHVVISSYGLILEDEKMFQKVKWQYLILDEAHSIKSVKSARWKTLLGLDVRNRLLLTGTPLQNNMQELWALLHFIMPSLFDSHEEFNEWFSKDIESNAKKSAGQPSSLNEQQVQRLHLILKPFMLRRVKKDIEFEMVKKEEKNIICKLSYRQTQLYKWVKDTIKNNKSSSETVLANLVMQLRKVCNHADLLEKSDVESPYQFQFPDLDLSTNRYEVKCLNKNPIELNIPKIIYRELLDQENLPCLFNIYDTNNIHKNETFSFQKVIKKSPGEISWLSKANVFEQLLYYLYQDKGIELPRIEEQPLIKELSTKYIKVLAPPIQLNVSDRSFSYKMYDQMNNPWIKNLLLGFSVVSPKPFITLSVTSNTIIPNSEKFENKRLIELNDYIRVPNFENVLNGSGKLLVLDELLQKLFKRKDKVLIFSQMTKMLNILEDYMHYRNYKYLRLDGSTSISDRNEMVTSFQKRSDIFVFLLSTRAGGLGINLTSANTVIFYCSDWNPTSDAQAMDRCHRIGQTRPVTVYRLISENTIEERIMKVASQKSFIQETVYKGSIQPVENNKEVMMKLLNED